MKIRNVSLPMDSHVSYPSYYILQKKEVYIVESPLSPNWYRDNFHKQLQVHLLIYVMGLRPKKRIVCSILSIWHGSRKNTFTLRDIGSHPGAYSSGKGFLHKHNTSGETRVIYGSC